MANSFRPSEGSLLDRLLAKTKRHPDVFDCGVRVRAGELPGESRRWRRKDSTVDPLPGDDGTVTLFHGAANALRLRVAPGSLTDAGHRPDEYAFDAVEQTSGATVRISVSGAELHRFGIHAE
ncbi:MAG: hypothetical protein FWD74_10435 [Actinomycetia bacterium]|nr:hypothetical protein [Actinomycetes bacterium]